jgi:hypothetical protein
VSGISDALEISLLINMTNAHRCFSQKKRRKTMKTKTKGSIGALFPNTKKTNPKAPALIGTLALDRQLFGQLMEVYEEGGDVEFQVSAWKNYASETGNQYLTLKAQINWSQRRREEDDPSAFQFLADLD